MTTIPTGTLSSPVPLARIAASSSFYTAMRVLPRERRDARARDAGARHGDVLAPRTPGGGRSAAVTRRGCDSQQS